MSALLSAVAGLPNAAEPVAGWITGGQPTEQQLKAFKCAGGEVLVDNRDPVEPRPFDEPSVARAIGLEYINVPMAHGATTLDTMKQIHDVLHKLFGRKALLHCASGNRTAAGIVPYLIINEGMSEEDATDKAMQLGLRSAELLELAIEYANLEPRS